MSDKRYVLSIDGGGMRGIIPALVLAELEELAGVRIADAFDLIGGTSTGGLLALGLVKPGGEGEPQYAAAELVELYEQEGDTIFPRSLLGRIHALGGIADERYDERPLEGLLQDRFGEMPLSEALTEVLITSYDVFDSHPFLFKRAYARERPEWNYPMWWVARATSAAPTYFEPFGIEPRVAGETEHVLVDGGVFANNPTLCAYVEALKLWGEETEIAVCSLGTGERGKRGLRKAEVDRWGAARWAPTILDVVFDGVSDSVDYQMHVLCRHTPPERPRYRRFQAVLPPGMDGALDNASPEQVAALKGLARDLVERARPGLEELAGELREHAGARAAGRA